MKYDLIELCCGLGAVTWAAVGAPKPPVSRIGAKTGYTGPILQALGIEPGTARKVLMIDWDPAVVEYCRTLSSPIYQDRVARAIEDAARTTKTMRSAQRRWRAARLADRTTNISEWFIYTAGARGGVGGFKGGHKSRPNVKGFIPSLASLAKQVREFELSEGSVVDVDWADAQTLNPRSYEPTKVYLDAPYPNRQGYGATADFKMLEVGERWRCAGHHVVVSGPGPLWTLVGYRMTIDGKTVGGPPEWSAREITELRKGQKRRSLTRDSVEWLSIGRQL